MSPLAFRITGEPKGQPRPRAFARKMGNVHVARFYDSDNDIKIMTGESKK